MAARGRVELERQLALLPLRRGEAGDGIRPPEPGVQLQRAAMQSLRIGHNAARVYILDLTVFARVE